MTIREKIARFLAPELMDSGQVKDLVKDEVRAARAALPINIDYDPKNEGYRRLTSEAEAEFRRDLTPVSQDLMIELAYFLYDTSGLVKRFVRDTKNFVLGAGVSFEVENDDDSACKDLLQAFWNDPINNLDLRLEKRVEFLCLLGEQCWPAAVNPHNGRVYLSYVDPANIDTVYKAASFPEITAAVKLKGSGGRPGRMLPAIRPETDIRRKEYGRLVGECFFFDVNNPPNATRGRSDLIHLFDFINAFEEGLFDELDRLKGILSYIWDVTLEGADENQIKAFLQDNPPPKANSVRAHNERVKWEAVSPNLRHSDSKAFFDLMKTYLAACACRPDSWLGAGGKAYQTEADLMGEPTFKELGSRQRYVKYIIENVLKFQIDQAVIHGALRENDQAPFKPVVSMPEMHTRDLKKIVDGLFTLAQALMIAESQGWVTAESAAGLFAGVAGQTGIEIAAAEQIRKSAGEAQVTEDYAAREALVAEIVERIEAAQRGRGEAEIRLVSA